MIRSIVRSSMQFRYLVVVLAVVMMVYGITQLRETSVDALPEFSPPFVEIQTEALGLSAEEVEEMITVPMEQDLLAGVAWLDIIRSESVPGLSSVLIYFEPGTDLYRARQMVAERLAQAAVGIPNVSKPPMMIQPTSSASRFMIVGLSSEQLSLIEMSVLAKWTIAPRLLSVPGVANVAIWGNRDRQLQVLVDPARLQDAGITLDQIVATTGNALWVSPLSFLEASSPGTGGFIDTPNQRIGIWHVLPISSPEELAKVPVERTLLLLGDVTDIVEGHQPLIGDAVVNDTANLLLVIEKLPGTNALDVTNGVEDALDALRPGFTEIKFDSTIFRPATFIEIAISNLTRTLMIGALCAVLILGILFYGWRPALISLLTIPMSLLAALLVLHRSGTTLNVMILAGLAIALGIIIDDAVVDVEQIVRRLRQNRQADNPRPVETVILEAAVEVRSPLFFATLATLLAILPVFFLQDVIAALFQPLATSYALAVLAAMAVALVAVPALTLLLFSSVQLESRESPLISRLRHRYESLLAKVLLRPRVIWVVTAVVGIAALVVLPSLWRAPMLPAFREPYLMIRFDGVPATSLPEMDRIAARASSELRTIPGVSNVAAHVGRAVFGDQVVGINSAELWVSINPAANYDATVAAIREVVDGYPGLDHEVRTYLQERLGQSEQAAADDPFIVRIYGNDYTVLLGEVERVRQLMADVQGVVDSHAVLPVQEPTIRIEADLNSAQRYGVKPGDVRRAAATLLSGIQVGSLFEEQKVFDVVVWSTPESRQNLSNIRDLLVDTPGGGHVRLGEVASVRIASAPTVIHREALSPYIDIGFNIRGRDVGAVLSDVKKAMQGHAFPREYHAQVQDDYAAGQAAGLNMFIVGLLAAVGVLLLLQASTRNWRLALTAFLMLPLALAGGVLAAFPAGGTLSLTSLFGLFAVFGITTRHTILLINHYLSLEQKGEAPGSRLVAQGSAERLASTVTTVLAIGLLLSPFVFSGNLAGHEVLRPMAIIILGGLITSAFLNLFVLPVVYLRYGSSREPDLGLA